MLNLGFLEKGLRIVSPPHFVNDFSREVFLLVHSINWSSFIVWLSLLFEILDNMCIATACFPGFHVINFEINLSNQIFFLHDQSQDQNLKILRTKKRFLGEIKGIFIIFKELTVATNCLRPKSAPLNYTFLIVEIRDTWRLFLFLFIFLNTCVYHITKSTLS